MSLGCMEHRGACSADNDSGDGAGLMTQIPWDLFKQEFPDLNEQTTGSVPLCLLFPQLSCFLMFALEKTFNEGQGCIAPLSLNHVPTGSAIYYAPFAGCTVLLLMMGGHGVLQGGHAVPAQ